MPHLMSGIDCLVLSVNLILVPLSPSCLFMLLPHLLTLSTHHSHHPYLPLFFTAGSRPTSFTNLSHHHRLPSNHRIVSTDFMTGPFLLSISVFVFSFFITLFLFGSMRSWLLVSFYSPSYRIVSYRLACSMFSSFKVVHRRTKIAGIGV